MKRILVVVADDTFGLIEPFPPQDDCRAQLSEATFKDTLALCQSLTLGPGWPPPNLVLAYSGNREWYARCAANYWLIVPQMGTTLAQRLDNLLIVLAPDPEDEILFIGPRTPQLEHRALQHAFIALGQRGACLGPTPEGGIYAIGIRGRWPAGVLQQVRWHDRHALADLQRVFRRLQLGLAILERAEPIQRLVQVTEVIAALPPCDRNNLPFLRSLSAGCS